MSLSPAATIVLARAAERPDRRLEFHRKLPTGGRHKMIDALLRDGLITETKGDYHLGDGALLVEDAATGLMLTTLVLTDAGFRALNLDPPNSEQARNTSATEAPVTTPRTSLREAAAAVLVAWDNDQLGLPEAIQRLRAALATKSGRSDRVPGVPRKPREGTKQAAVLALLRRPEGANIAQIVVATAWAQHTVRGFLANLKRKGITVEVLERVRQVGPGSTGARGSYSTYRIADAA